MLTKLLIPDGEVSDAVRGVLPNLEFSLFSQALTEDDLSAVEFYVPPYLGGPEVLEILPRLSGLKVVQLLTAGVDWIAPHVPTGVLLCRAVGVHESSVAEHVMAGILAMTKRIPAFVRSQAKAEWVHHRVGGLLGQRAIVLGHGAIGAAAGDLLRAFGVQVTGISRSGRHPTMPLSMIQLLIPTCDILLIVVPLTDETEGLVDEDVLKLLPNGALVVNVSRGPVVESAALERELVSGRIMAFLDVTDPEPLPAWSPLWHLPNVLISPHVGGDSDLFPRLAAELLAKQITRYLEGAPLAHQVVGKY